MSIESDRSKWIAIDTFLFGNVEKHLCWYTYTVAVKIVRTPVHEKICAFLSNESESKPQVLMFHELIMSCACTENLRSKYNLVHVVRQQKQKTYTFLHSKLSNHYIISSGYHWWECYVIFRRWVRVDYSKLRRKLLRVQQKSVSRITPRYRKEYPNDFREFVVNHFLDGDSEREIAKKRLDST